MPLKGIFLLDIIPQNLMLTHEGQTTQVPHNMEMEPQDVYFYKIINSANKQGFHVSEIPLDRTLDLKKKKRIYIMSIFLVQLKQPTALKLPWLFQ